MFLKNLLKNFVAMYQNYLSPFMGSNCRFHPTCSSYCLECLKNYSFVKSIYLTFLRLLKCHPWHAGGFDPAPKN